MYLWNIKALADQLKDKRLSEKEQLKYFLLSGVFSYWPSSQSKSWSDFMIFSSIFVLGIIWCFRTNERGDNQEFVVRTTCLSVPIFVRIASGGALLIFVVAAAIMLLAHYTFGIGWNEILTFTHDNGRILGLFTSAIVISVFFLWLRYYIYYVASSVKS